MEHQLPMFCLQRLHEGDRGRSRDHLEGKIESGHFLPLEEPELVGAVADKLVFCLLVVVQHDLVVFSSDSGLLVATECSMCRIEVITVGPDASGLDGAAELIRTVQVASPDAGTETVERVVGDGESFIVVLEGGDGDDRSEDLLLEDAHLIVTLEDCGLDIEAIGEVAVEFGALTAGEDLRTLLTPYV